MVFWMGQEGISVGSTYAMDEDEYILPMHRNPGLQPEIFPFKNCFLSFKGKQMALQKKIVRFILEQRSYSWHDFTPRLST